MRLSVCFTILVLAVALAKASPAAKAAEKKSLVEDAKLESKKEELKIEDTGSDRDRSKKSASFCVEIKPGSSNPVQVPCKGSQQVVQKANFAVQSEPVAQPVQSYSVVQPSYIQSSYVPSSYIQSSFAQPSYIQSSFAQPSYVPALSQQMAQPYQSFQLIQSSSQPCTQSESSVNLVPSVPQADIVPQATIQQPNTKSEPAVPKEALKEQSEPESIEEASEPLPVPQENLAILPVAHSYHEHLFSLPSSPMVMYPELEQMQLANVLQDSPTVLPSNILNQCPCQNNMATFSEAAVEPMAVKMLPYSSPVSGSPVVMPYNGKMHITAHEHGKGPMQPRHHHGHFHTHGHFNLNAGIPQSYIMPASQYVTSNMGPGISINSYRAASPMTASSLRNAENAANSPLAFAMNDYMHSAKMPRETDSSTKTQEVKQLAEDNGKGVKEETKQA